MTSKTCNSVVFTLLILMASSVQVHASTYRFYQSFPDGGYVKGSFYGEDKYGADGGVNVPGYGPDGNLLNCGGRQCPFYQLNEVSKFSIEFGGNPLFKSINNLRDGGLVGISYDIKNNVLNGLFYSPCDGTCSPYWGYSHSGNFTLIFLPAGLYPAGNEGLFINSDQPMQTFQTPLPGTFWLFFAGVVSIARVVRKKHE